MRVQYLFYPMLLICRRFSKTTLFIPLLLTSNVASGVIQPDCLPILAGNFGYVRRVADTAVKFPHDTHLGRQTLAREIEILQYFRNLDPPDSIPKLISTNENTSTQVLKSMWVEGKPFTDHLDSDKINHANFKDRASDFFRQTNKIVEGLKWAHDRGVINMDVHPGNVIVTPQGNVVILDWGLAVRKKEGKLVSAPIAPPANPPKEIKDYFNRRHRAGVNITRAVDIFEVGVMVRNWTEMALARFPGDPKLKPVLKVINNEVTLLLGTKAELRPSETELMNMFNRWQNLIQTIPDPHS